MNHLALAQADIYFALKEEGWINFCLADCHASLLPEAVFDQKDCCAKNTVQEIQKAGRCFIIDGGFHPGLPVALVKYVAQYCDRLLLFLASLL